MLKNGHPEIIPFPHKNVNEAIQRGDAVGLLSCIQVHILHILADAPLIYDIQKNISDHIVALLRDNVQQISTEQESSMRELLQTVYRGMRHTDTRRASIARSVQKGLPLFEEIMTGRKITLSVPFNHTPLASTEIDGETPLSPSPLPTEPESISKREIKGESLRKSKYSSDTPPEIPEGFKVDWDAKKWKAFCLFYGYSPKTGTFGAQTHTRAQIAETLGVTIMDVAVYFTTTHQHIASWVPKVKKEKKRSKTIKKTPRVVKEKPVKEKKISVPLHKTPKNALKIARNIPIKTAPHDGDDEDDDEDDIADDEIRDEAEKGKIETKELGDEISTLIRKNLHHHLLTPEEEIVLGNIIEGDAMQRNQVALTQELLDNTAHLLQFSPPKIPKKIVIPEIRRDVEGLEAGQILTGELLVSIRSVVRSFLEGTAKQRELADTILSDIDSDIISKEAGEAVDTLIRHNLRLVFSIAKRYTNRGLDLIDLYQEGSIGLLKAAKRYSPSFENKFSTYAVWWIKQAITRAIANQSRTIRVPINFQSGNRLLQRVKMLISNNLGRDPTDEEVAEELGIPVKTIVRWQQAMYTISSLDEHLGGDANNITMGDMIADTRTPATDHGAILSDEQETLTNFLKTLTEKERDILHRRFGMNGYDIQTLEEVGRHYNVTRERIRQIEAKALRKMNKKMEHRNPFKNDNGGESPIKQATIDMLLQEMKGSKLTSEEKNLLMAWGGLGQKAASLASIADDMRIPLSRALLMKVDALKKVPLFVRQALELRGYKNNQ